MKKKEDRRVKFTKMFLRDSLIELLEEKRIEKITISEICKKADINRATFYAHYSDQYDLLRSIEQSYVDKIMVDIGASNRDPEDLYNLILDILQFIKDNSRISKLLLSNRGDIAFQTRIVSLVYNNYYNQVTVDDQTKARLPEMAFTYVIYGCVGIILKWSNEDFDTSPEDVSRLITTLTTENMIRITETSSK